MRLLTFPAMALSLCGCLVNFDETTYVKIRQPSEVSVGVQTPRGGEWLLPAGGPAGTAELPSSNPPLTEGDKFATVQRRLSGEVSLDCPSCDGAQHAQVVGDHQPIALRGDLERTLKWDAESGRLSMRYSHVAIFDCLRHRGHNCPREALSLSLSTPEANIVEIRHRKLVETAHHERVGAWIGAITGTLLLSGGIAMSGGYAFGDGHPPALLGVGSAFVAVGGLFAVAGVMGILAKDKDEILYRSPANTARLP
jgi:hypothetical protein